MPPGTLAKQCASGCGCTTERCASRGKGCVSCPVTCPAKARGSIVSNRTGCMASAMWSSPLDCSRRSNWLTGYVHTLAVIMRHISLSPKRLPDSALEAITTSQPGAGVTDGVGIRTGSGAGGCGVAMAGELPPGCAGTVGVPVSSPATVAVSPTVAVIVLVGVGVKVGTSVGGGGQPEAALSLFPSDIRGWLSKRAASSLCNCCLLYTSDAAD